MPKVRDTRRQSALELLGQLVNGPCFTQSNAFDGLFNQATATEDFKMWSHTWIVPAILDLIPELRKAMHDVPGVTESARISHVISKLERKNHDSNIQQKKKV